MKSWIFIFISFLFFSCIKNEKNYYSKYIYEYLGVVPKSKKYDFFIFLNPNTNCIACYAGSIETIKNSPINCRVNIITNSKVINSLESFKIDTNDLNIIIDDSDKIKSVNLNERFNSKLIVFNDKRLVFEKTIHAFNTDSISFFIKPYCK